MATYFRLQFETLDRREMLAADAALGIACSLDSMADALRQPAVPQPVVLASEEAPARHLVMVTHGWRSSDSGWPAQIRANVAQRVRERNDAETTHVQPLRWTEQLTRLPHAMTDADVDAVWEVVSFDWSGSANTFLPLAAARSAGEIGTRVANLLNDTTYATVHLIAHSAGSWLIDAMVTRIEARTPDTITQTTFLDSYTPENAWQRFGESADWAEHYLDDGVLPDTNAVFPNAINIDLSAWGPNDFDDSISFGADGHAWPWEWYLQTTIEPSGSRWGLAHSLEFGQISPSVELGANIVLGQPGDSNDDGQFTTADIIAVFARGRFESGQTATWQDGDWNRDGKFDSGDLVIAFQAGKYLG